ncbi:hypothetical protein ACS0TY_022222 [Phlomoides rotata]
MRWEDEDSGSLGTPVRVFQYEGVAVGAGWQSVVAYINIGCYYIVGLPLGIVLGFVFNFGATV